MEPTYFDKTADYPTGCPDNKYLLTAQNCSATRDSEGKVVLVTEDIRNGNGRAIKSKLWSPNRVDKINDPVNAIFWIMKDPTIYDSSTEKMSLNIDGEYDIRNINQKSFENEAKKLGLGKGDISGPTYEKPF